MAEMSHAEPEAKAEGEASSQANAPRDSRPIYEVAFHVVPTVGEDKLGSVVEKIRDVLAKGNTEILNEQFPQKTTLAYTVERAAAGTREKYTESYFGFIKFATERELIPQLETLLRGSQEILRHLLIETQREVPVVMRRAVFSSNRLEGETIKKPTSAPETPREVSEEELTKSIDALVS